MITRKELAKQANAIHEAGHTVSRWFEPVLPGVKRTTIKENASSLGSMTPKHKKWEASLSTKESSKALIRTLLAGRIAEEVCLGEAYIGSSDDHGNATLIAKTLVAHEGMNEELGPISIEQMAGSENLRKQIDDGIRAILQECREEEMKKLRRRKQEILRVAFALIEHETLKHKQLKEILGPRPKWRPKRGALKQKPAPKK